VVSVPLLRPIEDGKSCELQIGVYCHRLLFECDYANDLLVVMSALDRDSYHVSEPLLPPPAQPPEPVFESDPSHTVVFESEEKEQGENNDDNVVVIHDTDSEDDELSCCTRDENEVSAFSRQGLLKLMESKGNDISEWPVIQQKLSTCLKVDLMLHQVHGLCWMLQMESIKEKSPKYGLNALLWEVRQFSDGNGIYFYSPVLGQARVFLEKNPYVSPASVCCTVRTSHDHYFACLTLTH